MTRSEHVTAFLAAVDLSRDLVATPEVAQAWGLESSCEGMTVGGLAHHLLNQAGSALRLSRAQPTNDPPIPLLEHYARAAWVTAAPDDQVNLDIAETDNEAALAGHVDLLERAGRWAEALPRMLERDRDPDTIAIPWQGWCLTTTDFLTTRMMEMVVHGDDLAASVGLPTPTYPDGVLTPVLGLLTGVAVRRHGQAALVRALSRPQRAPASVSAF